MPLRPSTTDKARVSQRDRAVRKRKFRYDHPLQKIVVTRTVASTSRSSISEERAKGPMHCVRFHFQHAPGTPSPVPELVCHDRDCSAGIWVVRAKFEEGGSYLKINPLSSGDRLVQSSWLPGCRGDSREMHVRTAEATRLTRRSVKIIQLKASFVDLSMSPTCCVLCEAVCRVHEDTEKIHGGR